MTNSRTSTDQDDLTSFVVDISPYDTHGLLTNYSLRRHKFEAEANAGCRELRRDWLEYIGPNEQFGMCNPRNGNFAAVVLPLTKPDRLRLVAYTLEYFFLYDNVVELAGPAKSENDELQLMADHHVKDSRRINPTLGRKQLEAKIVLQLVETDKECSEHLLHVWKTRVTTALQPQDKDKHFESLEDYLQFRVVDAGVHYAEAVMLWGMGMRMSQEENERLAPVIEPCGAAVALVNDYFSFDREYAEFTESGAPLTNAVWLHMQWHNVDVKTAKEMVRHAAIDYEQRFVRNCDEFRQMNAPIPEKLDRYLNAIAYSRSGNVIWSLNCPRYHPDARYDPNAGIEDLLTAKFLADSIARSLASGVPSTPSNYPTEFVTQFGDDRLAESERIHNSSPTISSMPDNGDWSVKDEASTTPSRSSTDFEQDVKQSKPLKSFSRSSLGSLHVKAPFDYINSLPSKGVRVMLVDALNIWFQESEEKASRVKSIVGLLHNASLMLDDIQDCSDFRRGKPSTHTIFGTAQTINSANYAIVEAMNNVLRTYGASSIGIVLEELLDLHIGQSFDIYWTRHFHCPSEEEYLEMVAKKTGGMFRLLARLLLEDSLNEKLQSEIEELTKLMGLYFQIRDDYQNLQSSEYSDQKGFCEDLDEGKYSFPVVHALNSEGEGSRLREILQHRRDTGGLSRPHKLLALDVLERSGSLQYTRETVQRLQAQMQAVIHGLEEKTSRKNWILRLLLHNLSI